MYVPSNLPEEERLSIIKSLKEEYLKSTLIEQTLKAMGAVQLTDFYMRHFPHKTSNCNLCNGVGYLILDRSKDRIEMCAGCYGTGKIIILPNNWEGLLTSN